MASRRLHNVLSHVNPRETALQEVMQQNPDDVVITLAVRTPLCKGNKGGLKDTKLDMLLFRFLQQVVQKMGIRPGMVDDVCVGNVAEPKTLFYTRAALLATGFPHTTAVSSVNRFCSSGLKATQDVASQVASGSIAIGLAIGAESMTHGHGRVDRSINDDIIENDSEARDCVLNMGQTSENVAKEFGITREQHDRFAFESWRRAEVAQRSGWFDDEIVPIDVRLDGKPTTLTLDEGPRWETTYEALSKLKPAFEEDGRSTSGNSCQITDGAAAVLLMKRSTALQLGQPILAKYVGAAIVGVPPRIMGTGPAAAIPKLLDQYNLSLEKDIDLVEINEAFASMAAYCRDALNLDWSKLNVRGGAIALGHPVGCTGVRQIVTGLSECRRRAAKTLVTSMCIGSGMGMAGLFVNEQL